MNPSRFRALSNRMGSRGAAPFLAYFSIRTRQASAVWRDIDDSIPFSLGGTRNIARTARVIKRKFEAFATSHLFEPDFGIRPIERALDSA